MSNFCDLHISYTTIKYRLGAAETKKARINKLDIRQICLYNLLRILDQEGSLKNESHDAQERRPCTFCRHRGPAYAGPGIFKDEDTLRGIGIPICPNCGGLSYVLDSDNFRESAGAVGKLRFEYSGAAPSDRRALLLKFIQSIQEHFRRYGKSGQRNPAANIARMKPEEINEIVESMKRQFQTAPPQPKAQQSKTIN
jgi:hypothetical protein